MTGQRLLLESRVLQIAIDALAATWQRRAMAAAQPFIPQGARHGFRAGDVPSRKLNFYFPASMIGYFDELATALGGDDVGGDDRDATAGARAMEIVGPPSERYV